LAKYPAIPTGRYTPTRELEFVGLLEDVVEAMCNLHEADLCTCDPEGQANLHRTTRPDALQRAMANAQVELQRGALAAREQLERALRRAAQALKPALATHGKWTEDTCLN
jgi:hypothetical protein